MICDRCGNETRTYTMSMFNAQEICMECKKREEQHPDYQRACDAERAACAMGDYNFPGIGLPEDLR